ncbi:hypothetical protein HMPREF9096_01457 [Haemophilus sp. oral taxon 851 str. F0397]|nr:hypothetical protein HMPREF9096_01457 [Haemophilus sp. oral taxon 851 str. F0397]
MKSENRVGGNIKITLAMFATPAFARFEKIGVVANAAMRTTNIANVIRIAPAFYFEQVKGFAFG